MTAQTFPFIPENMLAPQLDSILVTKGDLVVVNFMDVIIFRVVEIGLGLDKPSNAADDNNTVATISKATKLVIQPKPVLRYQQILTYDTGGQLRYGQGPPKTNKGPLNLRIDARGIADESIQYDHGLDRMNKQDKTESPGMAQESAMILTMEVTVSTSKFHRQTRTFSALIPPNENAQAIIKRCMDSAVKTVDDENARLSSPASAPADQAPDPSQLFPNTEDIAKLQLLLQSVHNAVNKILSQWSAFAEGVKNDEQSETDKAEGDDSLG